MRRRGLGAVYNININCNKHVNININGYKYVNINIKIQQGRLAQWFDLAVDFRGCGFESSYITFCLNININCYESLNININVNKMLNINLKA